jgi:hypothetical protein
MHCTSYHAGKGVCIPASCPLRRSQSPHPAAANPQLQSICLLVLQRRHYIMALKRTAYLKRGANYTPAATLLRCVRPDQSSATVRCHYLTDGGVNFAFTMRRAEYFIPVGILLKCFVEVGAAAAACRKWTWLLAGNVGCDCRRSMSASCRRQGRLSYTQGISC